MATAEIRVNVWGDAPEQGSDDVFLGAFTRKCELAFLPRAGERIALSPFGMDLGGKFVDFSEVHVVEHWPSTGLVTVVVNHRAHDEAGFRAQAAAASPEWTAHPVTQ